MGQKHTTQTITKDELKTILENWNQGSQPVGIQSVTTPKLNKEGKELFGNVLKISHSGGLLGYSYQNSVNNQREREGKPQTFTTEPLWNGAGRRISPTLAVHEGLNTFYLSYKHQQTHRAIYIDGNLNPIIYETLKPYLPKTKPSPKQELNQEVKHREIKLDNVKRLRVKGVAYIVS